MTKFLWDIKRLLSGLYTPFLISLLLLFILRPTDRGGLYVAIWQLCFIAVIIAAIFNCIRKNWERTLAISLAIPAIIFNWLALAYMEKRFFLGAYLIFAFCFIFVAAASIVNQVVLHAKVTLETLRGVVCAYFLVAFAFAYTYYFIEFVDAGSFNQIFPDAVFMKHPHYLSEMMYFSFVTLLTIGFGDITPLVDSAKTFVIVEGIIGQFYIAILVSRLVAVYSIYSNKSIIIKAHPKKKN